MRAIKSTIGDRSSPLGVGRYLLIGAKNGSVEPTKTRTIILLGSGFTQDMSTLIPTRIVSKEINIPSAEASPESIFARIIIYIFSLALQIATSGRIQSSHIDSVGLSTMAIPSTALRPVMVPLEEAAGGLRQTHYPLTLRGTLLAALIIYGCLGPARTEADIIAATLGYTSATLFGLILIGTLVQGLRIRRALQVNISGTSSDNPVANESGRPTPIIIKTSPLSLLPGFTLSLNLGFESPGVTVPEFKFTGSLGRSRYLSHPVIFPHRGIWRLNETRITVGDQLGLTQLRWKLSGSEASRSFTITPPRTEIGRLPVISSCERVGDLITHSRERHGDQFDIRQYHPADGARRIVWKIFARRGELVSRHPESSMTPEGRVLIFTAALPSEDRMCGALVRYAEQLTELDLDIVAGCSGMRDSKAASSTAALQALLISSVWNADSDVTEVQSDLLRVLHQASENMNGESIRRVAIFTSPERFRSIRDIALMTTLGSTLEESQITPVFFIVTDAGSNQLGAQVVTRSSPDLPKIIRNWMLEPTTRPVAQDQQPLREFLQQCARSNWQIHMTTGAE